MDWLALIERVGIPSTILILLILSSRTIIKWLSTEILTPFLNSHIDMVSELKQSNRLNAKTLEKLTDLESIKTKYLKNIHNKVRKNMELTIGHNTKLDIIVDKLNKPILKIYTDPDKPA